MTNIGLSLKYKFPFSFMLENYLIKFEKFKFYVLINDKKLKDKNFQILQEKLIVS